MAKYTEQFKLQVVEDYLAGKGGFRALAECFGLDRGTLREWVAAYRYHGPQAFQAGQRRYAGAFKLSVLQHMRDERLSLRQTAARFDIRSYATVAAWQRRYDAEGAEAFAPRTSRPSRPMQKPPKPTHAPPVVKDEDRTRKDLIDELQDLRAEVAYLKKLDALLQAEKHLAQQKRRK